VKRIDLTVWERGDRVTTVRGPGVVTREASNPWASLPMVEVRLDEPDGKGWRDFYFASHDLRPEETA
jgi:hypothetical protein